MATGDDRARPVPAHEKMKLWKRAGSRCAFPDCFKDLDYRTRDPRFAGEVAHIVGDSRNGPRGADPLDLAQRHLYENLILLCPNHHDEVDTLPERYTVAELHRYKAEHEERIAELGRAAERRHRIGHPEALVWDQSGPRLFGPDNWRSHGSVRVLLETTLRRGGLVISPSDGGYGVNVDPTDRAQVALMRRLVNNPGVSRQPDPADPIPIVFDTVARLRGATRLGDRHEQVLETLWPGPLTILARPRGRFARRAARVVSGGRTLSVRQTGSPVEQVLSGESERGLTSMAVRTPDGDLVRSGDEAIDILLAAMDREEVHVPLAVVRDDRFLYSDRSTMVSLTPAGRDLEVVRDGCYSVQTLRRTLHR